MVVIIALLIVGVFIILGSMIPSYSDFGVLFGGFLIFVVLGVWGALTLANLECESLAESYQEDLRFDWMTGCMLPLEDGREVQIDEESIALIVRELVER